MTDIATATPAPHLRHWPAGVPHHLEVPDESLWAALARRAERSPDTVGLHFLGRDWIWGALVREAEQLAGALQGLGVAPGDRVILFAQNSPQLVLAFHALLRAGAVVVPVNPMNKADELVHYLTDSGARVGIAASDVAGELARANAAAKAQAPSKDRGLQHLVVFDIADALPAEGDAQAQAAVAAAGGQATAIATDWPAAWRDWLRARPALPAAGRAQLHRWQDLIAQDRAPTPVPARGEDLALLPYTSGTTGAAKGCMHTHATLMHNAMSAAPWLDLREGDSQLIAVPMFHITGLVMGMLACIRHGARLVLLPRWDRKVAARTIAQQRVTHWPNIPTMVIDLLGGDDLDQYDLSSLRYIGGGGAPMPDAVAERLQQAFGLVYVEGYGMTESAAPTHSNPRGGERRHCLGIPYIGTRALVVDHETLAPLPAGEPGEILVHGPQLFKGYWQLPEATAESFVEVAGQRWFRTGDMGRMDADGYFYMADRLKRMINASGFKVWPAEVESLMLRHPAIKEACVIATRDPYRGESVKALVVLRDGHVGQVDAPALIAWAREHMAAYKYPRDVEFVQELPRTASGKVLWRVAQARQDELDADKPQAR